MLKKPREKKETNNNDIGNAQEITTGNSPPQKTKEMLSEITERKNTNKTKA